MLIILGESGSGKTTLQRYICEHTNMKRAISHTTRPMRDGELDGLDYYFINDAKYIDMLNNSLFCESANYRGWFYGLSKDDIKNDIVFVATPSGLRRIKKYIKEYRLNIDVVSVYLKVDRLSRFIKILKRDGENGLNESYRRIISDQGMFSEFEDEVDIVLENKEYRFSVETLFDKLKHELEERGVTLV